MTPRSDPLPIGAEPPALMLHWDRDGVHWPNRDVSRFVHAGGMRWHVQEAGSGPVCLLLHGTGASTHSWGGLLPALAERYRVIAPDLPGHAFTDEAPDGDYSVSGMSEHVDRLLDRLGVEPQILVGHSAGAVIAVWLAVHTRLDPHLVVAVNGAFRPFPGLVQAIFGPLARWLAGTEFAPNWFARTASDDPDSVVRLLEGTGSQIDDRYLALYRRLFSSPAHVRATLRMMAAWKLDSVNRWLRRLTSELLLIVGERDAMIHPDDARRMHDRVSVSRLITMPSLGHLAHEEAPEEIADAIFRADDHTRRSDGKEPKEIEHAR